jgi:anaerobic magnesium-protoporphyrin IX monomethyl ester cyclase
MKVLFIYTDIGISVGYSCGIGVLSAFLKKHGHETKLIHVSDELGYPLDVDRIVRDVKEYNPGLICFSSVTNQWFYVQTIAKFIRRACRIPIVVGGHHANAASHQIIKERAVDFVCKGEGEIPLLELVNRIERNQSCDYIPNMLSKTNSVADEVKATGTYGLTGIPVQTQTGGGDHGCKQSGPTDFYLDDGMRVIDNPVGRWVDNLDELPFEDREVFDYDRIVKTRSGWAEVIASRGCPYACTYCFNVPFFDMYKKDLAGSQESVRMRDFVRRRSVESTVEMLREVKEKYSNVQYFTFVDDVFAIYSRWLSDLAPAYRDAVGLQFAATSQPLAFDEKIARLLKEMGCKVVKMGVEAGDPDIRNHVLNRNIPDRVLIDSFALARKYGLKPQAFNMIGLPSETKENMIQTARLNAKLRAYIVWVSTFMPYPGTVLDDFCKKNSLVDESRWDNVRSYRGGTVLKEISFRESDLERVRIMFRWYLNASLENECSSEYQKHIDDMSRLPDERWLTGELEDEWRIRDAELDTKFRAQKVDHYVGKKYINMLWAKEYDYDLS